MDHAWGSLRISTDYKQLQWFDISDRPTNNWWWRQYFSKSNYNLSTWGPLISLVLLVQMFWSPDKYNVPFILFSTTSLCMSLWSIKYWKLKLKLNLMIIAMTISFYLADIKPSVPSVHLEDYLYQIIIKSSSSRPLFPIIITISSVLLLLSLDKNLPQKQSPACVVGEKHLIYKLVFIVLIIHCW